MAEIAILGAGLRGLYIAYELEKQGHICTVFESSKRIGGALVSTRNSSGFLTEDGAHTLLINSEKIESLIQEMDGLKQDIIEPDSQKLNRYILRNNQLNPLQPNPIALLKTPLLSLKAKFKLFSESFRKKQTIDTNISLYDFFAKHFGTECTDYLLDPFIAGTYAGDPKKLSARHTFPKLVKASQSNGSIIRSILSNKNRFKNKIVSFKEGLVQLPIALSQSLKQKPITETELLQITQEDQRWKVEFQTGKHSPEQRIFDTVYSTIPAHKTHTLPLADSVKNTLPDFSSVEHPPVTVLSLGFHTDQFKKPLSGFGYLIPTKEKQDYLGVLFTSAIFKNRAPKNHSLITVFIGGSRNPNMASLSEPELISTVYPKIQNCLQIKGDPAFSYSRYWEHSIPQYHVAYDNVIDQIDHFETSYPNFYLSGNYRKGIALGDCFSDFNSPI